MSPEMSKLVLLLDNYMATTMKALCWVMVLGECADVGAILLHPVCHGKSIK